MSRRAGVALAEPEPANETISLLVVEELQAHAVGVIPAAAEAVAFWQTDVASVVSGVVRFLRHCRLFYREAAGAVAFLGRRAGQCEGQQIPVDSAQGKLSTGGRGSGCKGR